MAERCCTDLLRISLQIGNTSFPEFSDTAKDTLFKAAWTGDVTSIRSTNADVNLKDVLGRTPLGIAAEKGHTEVHNVSG